MTNKIVEKKQSVKNIIGIMSGKGGVGKSLVSALLAVGLTRKGYKVGLMDADVTGPSIPKILGVTNYAHSSDDKIIPTVAKSGVSVVSINMFLEDETTPVIWRGPMISNVIKQFWEDTSWGNLDYLLIDLPPGTSDVPLTVMQSIPIDGVVLVSTPQNLVAMIVEKAINMAKATDTYIIGLIENMSYLICPSCNQKINIFGDSQTSKSSVEKNIKFFGALPIDPQIAHLCDLGEIENYRSALFEGIVNNLIEEIEKLHINEKNITDKCNLKNTCSTCSCNEIGHNCNK